MNKIYIVVVRRGGLKFCAYPQDPVISIINEFYSNILERDQRNIFVRQV